MAGQPPAVLPGTTLPIFQGYPIAPHGPGFLYHAGPVFGNGIYRQSFSAQFVQPSATAAGTSQAKDLKWKLSISSFSTPLKVVVGEKKIEFLIQKGVLVGQSDFFKAACNERWESGRSNTVVLTEDDPEIFGIFLTWLLTNSINNFTGTVIVLEETKSAKSKKARLESASARYSQLLSCYFFGRFLQSTAFSNHVMDNIVSLCLQIFDEGNDLVAMSEKEIVRVFKNTEKSSPLRKFVLDCFLIRVNIEGWISNHDRPGFQDLHDPDLGFFECLVQLSVRIARAKYELPYPWIASPNTYHV